MTHDRRAGTGARFFRDSSGAVAALSVHLSGNRYIVVATYRGDPTAAPALARYVASECARIGLYPGVDVARVILAQRYGTEYGPNTVGYLSPRDATASQGNRSA